MSAHTQLPLDGRVTGVVVGFNSARHIAALGRALTCGQRAPDELLLVDNGSSDLTVATARSAGFRVHELGANGGFGAACNAALQLVDSEFVLICNPDIRPAPDALGQMVDALLQAPDAAVAGACCNHPGRALCYSGIVGNVWGFMPSPLKRALVRMAPEIALADIEPRFVDYVVGAFMLCRVGSLRSIGGFDEGFFLYCEEEDLSRRLSGRGWNTLIVPVSVVDHEDRSSSEGVTPDAMAAFYFHSLYRYYSKHRSRGYAELARCVIWACVCIDRAYRLLRGKRQFYTSGVATAPFRDINTLRSRFLAEPLTAGAS